jgi:hypothetical protein
VTGTAAGDVEPYVPTARAPNAYATGGRAGAVTSRVVDDYATGRLPEDQLVAVLLHELGHHATGGSADAASAVADRALARGEKHADRSCESLAGGQSRRGALIAVGAGLVVAVIQKLHQGQWMVGGVLIFVGLAAVLCPLAAVAISRQSEYAADRFTADHGFAIRLAAALGGLNDGGRVAAGRPQRLLATHPPLDRRITALLAVADKLGRRTTDVEGRGAGSLATTGAPAAVANRNYDSTAAGVTIKSSAVCQRVCQRASSTAVPAGSPPSTNRSDLHLRTTATRKELPSDQLVMRRSSVRFRQAALPRHPRRACGPG